MELNVITDLISFLYAILTGVLVGLIYDFYRAFRYFTKPKKILSHIEDLLFWIIISLLFFIILVKLTGGVLRGFVFGGFFLGGTLYYLALSKFIFSLIILFLKLILEMISEIMKILTYPFKKAFVYIKKKMKKVFLIPKVIVKEMGRYKKMMAGKK